MKRITRLRWRRAGIVFWILLYIAAIISTLLGVVGQYIQGNGSGMIGWFITSLLFVGLLIGEIKEARKEKTSG